MNSLSGKKKFQSILTISLSTQINPYIIYDSNQLMLFQGMEIAAIVRQKITCADEAIVKVAVYFASFSILRQLVDKMTLLLDYCKTSGAGVLGEVQLRRYL